MRLPCFSNTSLRRNQIFLYQSCFPRSNLLRSESCEFRIIASGIQTFSPYLGGRSAVTPICSSAQRRLPLLSTWAVNQHAPDSSRESPGTSQSIPTIAVVPGGS